MRPLAATTTLVLLALAPADARAHEILHEVEHGRATAVRTFFSDDEPLADADVEVYSPADPTTPHLRGRTDRRGWVAFVPDVPGAWRVKVVDASGHGIDLGVDVSAAPGPASPSTHDASSAREPSRLAFVLRPLVGLAVIGAVFAALVAARRRRGDRA